MFFAAQLLTDRGPLGLAWIASHLDKRLQKRQVSTGDSCQG